MIAMVGQYPPGTIVRLDSNEIGMVVESGEVAGKPVVRMLIDENGHPFSKPLDVSLSGSEGQGRMVASVVDPAVYGLDPVLS